MGWVSWGRYSTRSHNIEQQEVSKLKRMGPCSGEQKGRALNLCALPFVFCQIRATDGRIESLTTCIIILFGLYNSS